MKRREFIKNISITSFAISVGAIQGLNSKNLSYSSFLLLDTFSLNSFDDEQEEYPRLVTNGKGENWMFSLRRLPYPRKMEEIACYKLKGGKWQESVTASLNPGEYENPTAVCLPGGEPLVAWNRITNGKWEVQLVNYKNGKLSKPVTFAAPQGKAVHPRLVTGENGKVWLAWENYFQRKISIYVCKLRV